MENGIYLCIYVCINDNENRKNILKLYFFKKCSCDITDDAKKIGQKLRTFMLYVHFGVH